MARFENSTISKYKAISMVYANVSLSGNSSSGNMNSSIKEFVILKQFSIRVHHATTPSITQISWFPSPCYWVKYNSDGASRGSPGFSACGGLFRDYRTSIMGCFAGNLGMGNCLLNFMEQYMQLS